MHSVGVGTACFNRGSRTEHATHGPRPAAASPRRQPRAGRGLLTPPSPGDSAAKPGGGGNARNADLLGLAVHSGNCRLTPSGPDPRSRGPGSARQPGEGAPARAVRMRTRCCSPSRSLFAGECAVGSGGRRSVCGARVSGLSTGLGKRQGRNHLGRAGFEAAWGWGQGYTRKPGRVAAGGLSIKRGDSVVDLTACAKNCVVLRL